MAASIDKWVYRFGNGSADGCAKDKAFLGGKGECLWRRNDLDRLHLALRGQQHLDLAQPGV